MSTRKLVIIVGCEGFIGRNLLDKISSNKEIDILGIDKAIKRKYPKENVDILKLDVLKPGSIKGIKEFLTKKTPEEISIVHLAGVADVAECQNNEAKAYILNMESLEKICGISPDFNVKRIVFSSSALVYGTKYQEEISEEFLLNPETFYAKSKVEAENYLLNKFPAKAVILRLPNIYGSGGHKNTIVAAVLGQLKNNTLELKEYSSIRDFLYIKDAIGAFELALFAAPSFTIYNVGTSKGHSIYDFCAIAVKILHQEHLLPRIKESSRRTNKLVLSYERIKNDLNWHPSYSLETGITEMVKINGQEN